MSLLNRTYYLLILLMLGSVNMFKTLHMYEQLLTFGRPMSSLSHLELVALDINLVQFKCVKSATTSVISFEESPNVY